MKCKKFEIGLCACQDSTLPKDLEAHVASCPSCDAMWKDILRFASEAKKFDVQPSSDLKTRIWSAAYGESSAPIKTDRFKEYLMTNKKMITRAGFVAFATCILACITVFSASRAEAVETTWGRVKQQLLTAKSVRITNYLYDSASPETKKVDVVTYWLEGAKLRIDNGRSGVTYISRSDGTFQNWTRQGPAGGGKAKPESDPILKLVAPELNDNHLKPSSLKSKGRDLAEVSYEYAQNVPVKRFGVWEQFAHPMRVTYFVNRGLALPLEQRTFLNVNGIWRLSGVAQFDFNVAIRPELFEW